MYIESNIADKKKVRDVKLDEFLREKDKQIQQIETGIYIPGDGNNIKKLRSPQPTLRPIVNNSLENEINMKMTSAIQSDYFRNSQY